MTDAEDPAARRAALAEHQVALAALARPALDPAAGTIFRSGDVLHQHRADRPAHHPDDCGGACCWRRAAVAEPTSPGPAPAAAVTTEVAGPHQGPGVDEVGAEGRPVAASDLVAACEGAWAAIQARHPELPDTVVVLGSGVERGRLVKLGHWWGGQWRVGGQARGEVLLAGEALHLAPTDVFEVLLHEAAHSLNAARGIRDASRGGRYHNQHYKAAAAEVGLRPRRLDPYGWARTELTPATAEAYRDVIDRIGEEMRLARGLPGERRAGVEVGTGPGPQAGDGDTGGSGEGGGRSPSAACCSCEPPRRLRMAPSVLARGPVTCGLCGAGFALPGAEVAPPGVQASAAVGTEFVARRAQALAAEATAQRRAAGAAHLERLAAAIATVAPQRLDGALLAEAFRSARGEIAAWYDELAGLSPTEAVARAEAAGASVDLRTVALPGPERPPARAVEVQLPELGP